MHHEELGQPLHFIVRSIVVHDGMYELSLTGKRGRVVSRYIYVRKLVSMKALMCSTGRHFQGDSAQKSRFNQVTLAGTMLM